jgi:hypothetical protein
MITEEALGLLARGTGGVPRLLNQATQLALQFAHEAGQVPLDAEAAIEALRELSLPMPDEDEPPIGVAAALQDTEVEEAA